ncbi:MAG: dihydropteroate synthase [Candidatus Nanopelagicales bacterium]|nr:dihydropteroate synthase [Candidatus Nanopelagicales bacterium]
MTLVMGVLNVTPDSFSDGGRYASVADAIEAGRQMAERGAAWIDVGGESTRPGAQRVSLETELERVVPVVSGLATRGVAVSIDTTRATVARACVTAGAAMVNDVSGGLADPQMLETVADLEVDYVAMHWRAHSAAMQEFTAYDDVVEEVAESLQSRLQACAEAGIDPDRVILDPGLGFAKETHHNWELLAGLPRLQEIGPRVLVGASRKRFLGALLAADGQPREAADRDIATAAISALAAMHGVWGVRVHDVSGSIDAIKVAQAWQEAT